MRIGFCFGSAQIQCSSKKRFLGEEYAVTVPKPRAAGVPVSPVSARQTMEKRKAAKLALAAEYEAGRNGK